MDWTFDNGRTVRTWSAEDGYQERYDACIAHFASCAVSGEPYETPVEHWISLLRVLEAIYRLGKL
jgi:predicted dehydrogenase